MGEYFKCDGFDRDGYPCSSERVKLIEGPKGPRGPRGSAGKNYTTAHLSAVNTGGTILEVSAHGTAVPLNRFLVSRGFTPGESFTSFTVEKAGTYFMTYDVRTVQAASLKSRIVKNGAPLPETVRACSGGNSCFFASSICILNAGDVLALQLYSLDIAVSLQRESGASLVVVRLA